MALLELLPPSPPLQKKKKKEDGSHLLSMLLLYSAGIYLYIRKLRGGYGKTFSTLLEPEASVPKLVQNQHKAKVK